MKTKTFTTLSIVCCIVFSTAFAYDYPDTCVPGICDGDLRDGGVTKGTFTNWAFLADTTTSGDWSYTITEGTVQSTNAAGTYTYNPGVSASATYTGLANFPAHPEYGTSTYTLLLDLTFPGGLCEGTWSIDFANSMWTDLAGTWHHTSRYSSPMAGHVYGIFIEDGINYDEPDNNEVNYEFYLDIVTDTTVDLISVQTPGTPSLAAGINFDIPKLANQWDDVNQVWTTYEYDPYEDAYYWEYSKNAFTPGELDPYGDGWYDVTVFYAGGGSDNTRVWFSKLADTIAVTQPIQKPLFTNITNHQRMQSPITFEWILCTDPNATAVWVDAENLLDEQEIEISTPKSQTSYGPVDFNDGYWEFEILFDNFYIVPHNADGIPYGYAKYSESNYMVGVGILAEITGDNIINFKDFAKFARGWLDNDCYEFNGYCDRADLNFDNLVDNDDLKIIVDDWLEQP